MAKRAQDPWAGRGGYTTLNKDSKVVWEPGLPAQVVVRRQHTVRKPADDDDVTCDLKATLKLTPDDKGDWLEKAVKAIRKSQVKAIDVYDIVTHPRFVSGVGNRVGQRMLRSVTDSILVFSEKQRDAFTKSKLFQDFAVASQLQPNRKAGDSDDEARRSRSRSRSSASPAPGEELRRRSTSREKDSRGSRSARLAEEFRGGHDDRPPLPSGEAESKRHSKHHSREEKDLIAQALREAEDKREDDRMKAEGERKAAQDRELNRRAKLGSAFLVDDEDEEEDGEQMHMELAQKAQAKRQEERASMIDYSRSGQQGSSSIGDDAPEAVHFVESMGGGSILQQAHLMLLQKAGDRKSVV